MASSKLVLLALVLLLAGNLAIIANQYKSLKAFNSESESLNQKLISAQSKYKTNIEKIGFLISAQNTTINSANDFSNQASNPAEQTQTSNFNKTFYPSKTSYSNKILAKKYYPQKSVTQIASLEQPNNKTENSNNDEITQKIEITQKTDNKIEQKNYNEQAEKNNAETKIRQLDEPNKDEFKPKRCFNYQ